ncbi:MAG: MgtC/SapB family protein [Eubacteriales bacterium]|nr:MgtC/SapB family protein [Eubacteriales bacterium]
MSQMIAYLHEFNLASVTLRMVLSMVMGGALGLERGMKRRPAGLRTYMLVCMGASLVMLTSQYIVRLYGSGDPLRMGAQVISGIGFLGAGTIMVTGRTQVKGLTTAASLWAAACMGIAIGIGFLWGAMVGFLFMFLAQTLFHRFEMLLYRYSPVIDLRAELDDVGNVGALITLARNQGLQVSELEISKSNIKTAPSVVIQFTVKMDQRRAHADVISALGTSEGVLFIEEVK